MPKAYTNFKILMIFFSFTQRLNAASENQAKKRPEVTNVPVIHEPAANAAETDKKMWKNTLNSILDSNLSNANLKLHFTAPIAEKNENCIAEQSLLSTSKTTSSTSKVKPQLPQRMLDVEPRESISHPKAANNEQFYDLPSPPMDLLSNIKPVGSETLIKVTNSPGLVRKQSIGSSNSSMLSKPSFKRSISNEQSEQTTTTFEIQSDESQIIGKDLLKRVSNRLSSGSFIAESKVDKNPLVSNELSVLLARQKKKIEDCDSANLLFQKNDSNSATNVKKPSPTLARKPPPPPRSDRSAMNKRHLHENENRNV